MKDKLRSNFEKGSTRWAVRRAQWIAMGIPEEDFDKPKIAVINSSSSLSVCYQHLDEMSRFAQQAIRAAGGLPFEIHTVAPSDFITSAGKKARYIMPSRDLLVNDIEVMVEGAMLDGMLMLSSCDKTTPGQLMAAARLNIPSIIVPCGYQLGGECRGREVDIEEVYKGVGTLLTGKLSMEEMEDWTRCAIKGPGVCAGLATANSMHCMAEALGIALSGTTPIRAASDRLIKTIQRAGYKILDLIDNNVRPRDILTPKAFENAVKVAIATGCSVNTIRHLTAISVEAELDLDVVKLFEQESKDLPQITLVRPNGPHRIEHFDAAGGTRGVLYQLREGLHTNVKTVEEKILGDLLGESISVDEDFIRPLDRPFRDEPGLMIIRGNLAPGGAIIKLSALEGAHRVFEGTAKVFEDEDQAMEELSRGTVEPGDIIVLRMMGPKGGPGTVFACGFMAAVAGAGLADSVSIITDGELSGLNKGITVGQVMPEAARGGPLAIVENGDWINIDLEKREINLLISEEEYKTRLDEWKPQERDLPNNWLKFYSHNVMPLEKGAVFGERK